MTAAGRPRSRMVVVPAAGLKPDGCCRTDQRQDDGSAGPSHAGFPRPIDASGPATSPGSLTLTTGAGNENYRGLLYTGLPSFDAPGGRSACTNGQIPSMRPRFQERSLGDMARGVRRIRTGTPPGSGVRALH